MRQVLCRRHPAFPGLLRRARHHTPAVHRLCSPCLRHGSHRGKRVGTAPAVSIMSAYLGDAQRGTPVSCRRGDKAAAMASYTKQAKDESLQYLAMRARAIRAGATRTKECRFLARRAASRYGPRSAGSVALLCASDRVREGSIEALDGVEPVAGERCE